jgi:hypothetical protein
MTHESPVAVLSQLSRPSLGVFGGQAAIALGVSRNQLAALHKAGVIEREFPDTYRMTAVARSAEQRLRAALAWAGEGAAAAGRSAGECYGLEGIRGAKPEIVVPRACGARSPDVVVHRSDQRDALMLRRHRGVKVTGPEATLVALAAVLEEEAFEIACEDARRRRLVSMAGLRTYLDRHGRPGRVGTGSLRHQLRQLDPAHTSFDLGGQDASAPHRARLHRLRARAPARMERAPVPLRLRLHQPNDDSRDEWSAVARRLGGL